MLRHDTACSGIAQLIFNTAIVSTYHLISPCRIKGGAVDFSAMLGRPDAAAEAAKRGGDVLDIDVAAADRAVRKVRGWRGWWG